MFKRGNKNASKARSVDVEPSSENRLQEITPAQWLDQLLAEAIRQGASDVHIVPGDSQMVVHFRIDGAIQTIGQWDMASHEQVVSRIKAISGMDVVKHTLPQDGQMQEVLSIADENPSNDVSQPQANFRVSTMPTIYGEVVVLRTLNKVSNLLKLDKLGLSEDAYEKVNETLQKNHGITLVTGQADGGKTTTLYSMLDVISHQNKNILTLEDPVEYRMSGVRQTQVSPDDSEGFSWSEGMKAALRQDPDTLMVGEICDEKTAQTAVHAALTGRQIFSTFDASSVEGVIVQLSDMNLGRSQLASAMNAILSQRLVRKICNECRVQKSADPKHLSVLGIEGTFQGPDYEGHGCEACGGTGFRGRTGLFEVLVLDDDLRDEILRGAAYRELQLKIRQKITESLTDDGVAKVQNGVTSLEELVGAVV